MLTYESATIYLLYGYWPAWTRARAALAQARLLDLPPTSADAPPAIDPAPTPTPAPRRAGRKLVGMVAAMLATGVGLGLGLKRRCVTCGMSRGFHRFGCPGA